MKVALVSRDYRYEDGKFLHDDYGFSPFIGETVKCCADAKCDVVLFCMWAFLEPRYGFLSRDIVYSSTDRKPWVYVPVAQSRARPKGVQIFSALSSSRRYKEHFSENDEPECRKRCFVEEFVARMRGDVGLIQCGEISILDVDVRRRRVIDRFRFLSLLKEMRACVLLNPVHDWMPEYVQGIRKRVLSMDCRWLLSVWYGGVRRTGNYRGDPFYPWSAYHDGKDVSGLIEELDETPNLGVRIGVVSV